MFSMPIQARRRLGAHLAVVTLGFGGGFGLENVLGQDASAHSSLRLSGIEIAAHPKRRKPAVPRAPKVPKALLERIANCESHGNPRAIGGGGAYRGKYQFDYGTWARVGGKGDPAAAPEAEQDARAAILYSRSGSNPWPVCG